MPEIPYVARRSGQGARLSANERQTMTQLLQPSEMTHEELAKYAIRIGTRDNNDALWSLGWDLQEAVNHETDGDAIAAKIIEAL